MPYISTRLVLRLLLYYTTVRHRCLQGLPQDTCGTIMPRAAVTMSEPQCGYVAIWLHHKWLTMWLHHNHAPLMSKRSRSWNIYVMVMTTMSQQTMLRLLCQSGVRIKLHLTMAQLHHVTVSQPWHKRVTTNHAAKMMSIVYNMLVEGLLPCALHICFWFTYKCHQNIIQLIVQAKSTTLNGQV